MITQKEKQLVKLNKEYESLKKNNEMIDEKIRNYIDKIDELEDEITHLKALEFYNNLKPDKCYKIFDEEDQATSYIMVNSKSDEPELYGKFTLYGNVVHVMTDGSITFDNEFFISTWQLNTITMSEITSDEFNELIKKQIDNITSKFVF